MTHVVISGNPIDGFFVEGPFVNATEASEWASSNLDNDWWTSELGEVERDGKKLHPGDLYVPNDSHRDEHEVVVAAFKATLTNQYWMVTINGTKVPTADAYAIHSLSPGFNHGSVVKDKHGNIYYVDRNAMVFKDMVDMRIVPWDEVERPLTVVYSGM